MKEKFINIQIAFLVIMVFLSLTQLFGLGIAGYVVLFGIAFFFFDKTFRKVPFSESGLDIKLIGANLKDRKIFFWILLPISTTIIPVFLSEIIFPEYVSHVLSRVENFVSLDNISPMLFQFVVLALGEEIAWRAFFQNKIAKYMPIIPAILVTSALFAIGHISDGNILIVLYDIFFVFIDSIIFGIIFYKTKNAWISFFAHLLGNLAGIFILLCLR